MNPGKGKKPLRAQKPIATRDNRKPAQIRASIKLGPSLETRAGLFKDAIEDKPYASRKFTFDELEPQAHDVDALMQQADPESEGVMPLKRFLAVVRTRREQVDKARREREGAGVPVRERGV